MLDIASPLFVDPSPPTFLPTVDIVVPVHDEAAGLGPSIRRLHGYLTERFPLDWVITIADNASTDGTWALACRLSTELQRVRAVHLERKGRGRALRAAWSSSEARVVAYMDVDLSTDLDALLPLVAPLVSGHSDVAIGTRLAPAARVVRGPRREAISQAYNLLVRTVLRVGFSDAQCGFKAVRADTARALLPDIEDDAWFFDTELLVLAERRGLRIHEVPVDWVDDPDSRVDVLHTAAADLRGIARIAGRAASDAWHPSRAMDDPAPAGPPDRGGRVPRDRLTSQLVRFASVGLASTALFAVLFAALRVPLGAGWAVTAAMAVCAVANTAANRRLTFTLRGSADRARHVAGGLVLGLVPLALALGALGVLEAVGVTAPLPELVAVTAASAAGSLARFVALRSWVFAPTPRARTAAPSGAPVRVLGG